MLTPEQAKQVEEVRTQLSRYGNRSDVLATTADTLLAIVDDLRKQQPKQYTEEELKIEFDKRYYATATPLVPKPRDLYAIAANTWFSCARFTGAIKE